MATLRERKKRIKSAQNIGKVTKALQMISAVRMRKAQTDALMSRPYAMQLVDTLRSLPASDTPHPLLSGNDAKKVLLIIIAPDRGLAGSLITNLFRATYKWSREKDVDCVTVGKKAAGIALRSKLNLTSDFPASQINTLANSVVDDYQAGKYSSVHVAYCRFVNTMTQEPDVVQFLPVNLSNVVAAADAPPAGPQAIYTFEPAPAQVLDFVINEYLRSTLSQILRDSLAAEHSARFVAMKNAYDSSVTIVKEINLVYNKTRQEKITNEISDIASATLF